MDVKCAFSDIYESAALWLEDVCDTIFIKDNIIRVEESPHGVYGIFTWDIDGDYRPHPPTPGADEFVVIGKGSVKETGSFVSIYPNPATGKVRVEAENMKQIEMISMQGEVLAKAKVNAGYYELDLSSFSKAVYFIKILTQEGIVVKKLVLN